MSDAASIVASDPESEVSTVDAVLHLPFYVCVILSDSKVSDGHLRRVWRSTFFTNDCISISLTININATPMTIHPQTLNQHRNQQHHLWSCLLLAPEVSSITVSGFPQVLPFLLMLSF